MTNEQLKSVLDLINQRFWALEARVYAAESLAANAQASLLAMHGLGPEFVKKLAEDQREAMAKIAFPQLGAAGSDAWAAELEAATASLLERLETMLVRKLAA